MEVNNKINKQKNLREDMSNEYWIETLGFDPEEIDYSKNPKALYVINQFKKYDKLDSLFDYLASGVVEPFNSEEDFLDYVADTDIDDYEIYNGKLEESANNDEITIPGLTSYKNIADTFKNYKAFEANFEPVIIVKINRQYYVYKTTAESSQDYSYQTGSEANIEGWLYGMIQANNHIFKSLSEEFKKSKKIESEDNSLDGKDVTNQFEYIKAFNANFEPVRIIKNDYDSNYYIYRADETDSKNYLDYSSSDKYVEGWLMGAVKANNGIIKNVTESLHNDKIIEEVKRIPTSELPDFCYAYNDTTGEIIVIKKGVEGYYPSNIKLDNNLTGEERKQQAEEIIKEQNEMLDVTEDQALQMQLNSMFGWDDTKTENKKVTESDIKYAFELSLPDCDSLKFTDDWSVNDAKKEYMDNEGANSKYSIKDIKVTRLYENKKLKKEDMTQEEQELAEDYKNRVNKMITDTTTNAFTQLKEILENEHKDTEVEGFYFPEKAVQIINNSKTQYHLNGYMDLTVTDVLNYVEDFDSVTDVIDDIFSEYKPDSALSWADNFVTILNKLDFDIDDYSDEDYYEESKKLNEDNTTDLESLKNILENDGWGPIDESEQDGKTVWEIRQFTPAGEDWSFVIFFDGTAKDAINEIASYANDFDADEEQSTYIDMRGQRGIPDDIQTLIDDGKWKKEALMELANKLQQSDLSESKKITESNDNTNILWENIEDYSEEEKENIRDIIDKLNVKAVESKEHSVKVRDENSKLEFWIDYTFDGFDIVGEWNQYIFNTDNETDRIKQAIQTSYDADTESLIAFDQMESEGFAYLEKKGIVKDTNDGYRFTD